jgi:small subunit ribosomal protein S27Ae
MMTRDVFKVEGDKIVRQRKSCPKCGDGVFLGDHKDRLSCGKCGYTEFKVKKQESEKPKE